MKEVGRGRKLQNWLRVGQVIWSFCLGWMSEGGTSRNRRAAMQNRKIYSVVCWAWNPFYLTLKMTTSHSFLPVFLLWETFSKKCSVEGWAVYLCLGVMIRTWGGFCLEHEYKCQGSIFESQIHFPVISTP